MKLISLLKIFIPSTPHEYLQDLKQEFFKIMSFEIGDSAWQVEWRCVPWLLRHVYQSLNLKDMSKRLLYRIWEGELNKYVLLMGF